MATSRTAIAASIIAFGALSGFHLWTMRVRTTMEGFPVGFNVDVFEKKLLGDGSPLKTQYTGVAPFDVVLSMLVAAFMPGSAGWLPVFKVQQMYFLAQFFAVCAVMTVESQRVGNRGRAVRFTGICAALYQCLGAAIVLPLYFAMFTWASSKPGYFTSGREVPTAKVLLPSLILGYVIPTALMFFPFPFGSDLIAYQNLAAFWQPAPLYPNLLVFLFSLVPGLGSKQQLARKDADVSHLKLVYLLAGIVSVASHVGLIYVCSVPGSGLSLSTVLLPDEALRMKDMANGLLWIFQWDFIGTFSAALLWSWLSVVEVGQVAGQKATGGVVAVGTIGLLTVLGGPGAALAAVWLWREGKMAESRAGARKKVL